VVQKLGHTHPAETRSEESAANECHGKAEDRGTYLVRVLQISFENKQGKQTTKLTAGGRPR